MEFETLWNEITRALKEPLLLTVPEEGERFHAWYDAGGDGKPEAIWTKPLQGDRQVRLPQYERDYRKVFDAVTSGACSDAADCRELTLRGHYLFTVMRHFGWTP